VKPSRIERKTAGVPTIKRMPLYLRLLRQMQAEGKTYASSAVLARALGLEPIVVRKDLAITGAVGRPRLGFPLNELIEHIERFLGWNNTTDAFLAGTGSLGSALLGYAGFAQHGLSITAAFDRDPQIVGSVVHGKKILPIHKLPELARRMHVQLGILTVPEAAAQSVAERMVDGGIRGIWNFTPVRLDLPPHIILQREDLAASLAVLSHRLYLHDPLPEG
jgi:redox-sensing transcriptional repressor